MVYLNAISEKQQDNLYTEQKGEILLFAGQPTDFRETSLCIVSYLIYSPPSTQLVQSFLKHNNQTRSLHYS